MLKGINNPASPDYHHYLTPEQFAAMFGPTKQDYQAVIAFAKAHGMSVLTTHPGHTLVSVEAGVPDIEPGAACESGCVSAPDGEARTFFAPDVEPSLDLQVPVLALGGGQRFVTPHSRVQVSPKESRPLPQEWFLPA